MERASQVAAIVAALTGISSVLLLVALNRQQISEWELWDTMRRSAPDDATVLVAKLRNDKEGRYTEDLLQWVDQQGKQFYELGRSWRQDKETEEHAGKRDKALTRTRSLALIEGYVGADEAVVRIWAKGGGTSAEGIFRRGKHDLEELADALERMVVTGMTYEAWLTRAQIGNDKEYEWVRDRARQVRRQLTTEKWQKEAEFIIAYIENIRADKIGEEEAQQAALGIYTRLLTEVQEEETRMRLLVNLGIAEFRVAKQEGSEKMAKAAVRKWYEAEQIAAERGLIEAWASTRNFQTEGELFIHDIHVNIEGVVTALKRQIETFKDTQGVLSEGAMLATRTWLTRADEAKSELQVEENCIPKKVAARGTQDMKMDIACRVLEEIQWSEEEFVEREARTERWLKIARVKGKELVASYLVGIRANLLRARGLRENDPGLLITSFEATHEFRSKVGIIDDAVVEGNLIIGVPQVVELVELEASLALACADLDYIKKLAREIRVAELWCRQDDMEHCEARQAWRRNVISALEYGVASWKKGEMGDGRRSMALKDRSPEIWRHAAWVRDKGAMLAGAKSLCPNRPQGIGEYEDQQGNNEVYTRTNTYQKIQRPLECILPHRVLTTAPSLPPDVEQVEDWHKRIGAWIDVSRKSFQEDVQTIKSCGGEPW